MPKLPDKLFFKIGEVARLTQTEPYVLRYWESEFPSLSPMKNKGGQRLYKKKDIETILHIKELLQVDGYTIAGARAKLKEESGRQRREHLPAEDKLSAKLKSLKKGLHTILTILQKKDIN
ncbi:MAG: MerR family transcriptional regulator [Acidobacteriota bacterium]